jgi:hypothetical protein
MALPPLATDTTPNGIPPVKKADQIDLGDTATKGDIWKGAGTGATMGGVASFFMGNLFGTGLGQDANALLPDLVPGVYSKQRDKVLSSTIKYDPYWNGAVKKAIAKGVTQQWDFKFNDRNRATAERLQELFKASNGRRGFKHFLIQHLQDYFLTDNGAFIELDREDNNKPGSKIIGIYHLDSLRCYRTGDPDRPVIYWDLHNHYHYLRWWQVWDISDMPNARNNYFGVGDCAAGGVYERIRRMVAIRLYEYQKISGNSPKELNFLSGITQQQLDMLLSTNEASQRARGMTVYGGAAMIAMMSKDAISHVKVPIASLPDNYDQEKELEQASVEYSNVLGISKQDLKPLMGKMSGTATQSAVMDSQGESSGLGLWSGAFEDFINECVMPSTVSFYWAFNKTSQKKAEAEVAGLWITAATGMVTGQMLLPQQANNWLVDKDVLDAEYLAETDITQTQILGEDDKPDVVDPATGKPLQTAAGAQPGQGQAGQGDAMAQAAQILGTKV